MLPNNAPDAHKTRRRKIFKRILLVCVLLAAAGLALLAGLVFLSALARALYLPGTSDGRTLCAGGLAAFALCLCWELPRVLLLLAAGFGGGMAAVLPELLSGLALCYIGGMGLACIGQGKAGNN